MKAKSIKGRSPDEIQSALKQSMAGGFKPKLAFIFISVKQDRDAVCNIFHKESISIFGATTSGEFVNSEISEGGMAIMLLDINPAYFKILFFETSDSSAFETSTQLGAEGKKLFSNPAFIIASGWLHTDGEQIVKGIQEGFGSEVTVFGAMAGDDLALREPLVFTHEKTSITGLVAIVIDEDKIDVKGIATCGWKPIGITKTVTKSKGNIVYTIDDQPALDLVIKYLGLNIDNETGDNVVTNLGAYYPLQLEREDA